MKKWMSAAAAAAALTLTASCALAATADAKIVAPNTEKITAPFAGTLLPFDAELGDSVSAGETLFTLDTVPVYAAQAGTVSAVFAKVGDDASGVAAHYGALAVVEPKNALYIDASTEQAYDDADNRYIHAGESLHLKMGNTKGTGVVTGVSGKKYTVEILTGDYDVGDTVRCFRESTTPSDSEVGRGKVTRYADVQVLADSGRIAAVHVIQAEAHHRDIRRARQAGRHGGGRRPALRAGGRAEREERLPQRRRRCKRRHHADEYCLRRAGLPRPAPVRSGGHEHAGAERRGG